MKLLLASFLPQILSAAASPLADSFPPLCSTSKTFLGVLVMLFIFVSIPLLALGALLFLFKKTDKNLQLAAKILLVLGGLALVLAALGIVIYVLMPSIITSLVGGGASVAC